MDSSRKRRLARALAGASIGALACAGAWTCSGGETLGEGVHAWGRYQLCLRRVSDTCHLETEPCTTLAADATRSVLLGVTLDTGEFRWSRASAPVASGRQVGSRFELAPDAVALPDVCGCRAIVRETIQGELSETRIPPIDCEAPDGGPSGCTGFDDVDGGADAGDPVADGGEAGADAGFGEGWLADADGGLDASTRYFSLRGRVVDEVVAAEGETGCSCLPCRVVYDVTGRP